MSKWAHMLVGEAKYRTLPRADPLVASKRAQICARCEHRQIWPVTDLGVLEAWATGKHPLSLWCGSPGQETASTCGCPVAGEGETGTPITVHGRDVLFEPIRKTVVDGESCPADKW